MLVKEVTNRVPLLASHDQELVRSCRTRSAFLLCKQRLGQWNQENYNIFETELNLNLRLAPNVASNIEILKTDYMRGVNNPSEWFGMILDRQSWRCKSEIEIDEVNNVRIFKIVLPLPPVVVKVPENWFWDIRGSTVDFTFVL